MERQPCHSPVMVFCSSRAIYLGFFQCSLLGRLVFLSPISNYFKTKLEWPSFPTPVCNGIQGSAYIIFFLNKYSITIRIYTIRTLPFPAMISLLVDFEMSFMLALVLPLPVTRSGELPGSQLVSFCCENM